MTAKPLDDIRVLELGQVYNAPYCGLLLSAQGAQVIKVEPPGGEIVRRHKISPAGMSYSFLMLNADKLGVTLNLKHQLGRDLFLGLVEHADVVLENFRDGVLDELGLGWDVLARRNPRVILASGRGYRPGSAYARFGAMDFTVQAISGHMSITGFPTQPPVKAGATLCDMLGSTHLFGAILLALRDRERTGRGRPVEVAMLDATFPALMASSSPYLEKGLDVGRTGNRHSVPGSSPYGIYPTTDGWVAIMCVTDEHWQRFCQLVDDPELSTNEELRTGPARAARRDWIDEHVVRWTSGKTRTAVVERLSPAGIPCAPVRTLGEAVDDPYNFEQGLLRHVHVEGWGQVRVLGSPIQLREPGAARADEEQPAPPPRLGEHNAQVYGDLLGLDAHALEELAANGVI
jgi:formyl-CoA transferase